VARQFPFFAFGQQFVVVHHRLEFVLAAQLEG
jgi:hypothetical protein